MPAGPMPWLISPSARIAWELTDIDRRLTNVERTGTRLTISAAAPLDSEGQLGGWHLDSSENIAYVKGATRWFPVGFQAEGHYTGSTLSVSPVAGSGTAISETVTDPLDPNIVVKVPTNGLIGFYAEAEIRGGTTPASGVGYTASVTIDEVGTTAVFTDGLGYNVPLAQEVTGNGARPDWMLRSLFPIYTSADPNNAFVASALSGIDGGGITLFRVAAGTYTFRLRYYCDQYFTSNCEFRNRLFRVFVL